MKNHKILIITCITVFILGIAGSIAVILKPHGHNVEIIQDGVILYTIDLNTSPDKTIVTEYNGNTNTIRIQNHQIFVESADCPDNTCVKMGVLQSYSTPVVCLPNKLIIRYTDAEVI